MVHIKVNIGLIACCNAFDEVIKFKAKSVEVGNWYRILGKIMAAFFFYSAQCV